MFECKHAALEPLADRYMEIAQTTKFLFTAPKVSLISATRILHHGTMTL